MSKAVPRLATCKDLLTLPEGVRGEVIAGQLRTAPSALPKHSRAMRSLGGADWICEILSPSNVAYDRVTKAQLYAKHGVQHFWLLDPTERILEAFELSGGLWTRTDSYDDTATATVKPFEAIELNVGELFPPK